MRRLPMARLLFAAAALSSGLSWADSPMQIFEEGNYGGRNAELSTHTIFRGESIPADLDAKVSSLILKQGHQVVIATEPNGMGLSKVLIAAKRDVRIPKLSAAFNDRIRYLRVLPWRNVTKKGHGGKDFKGLNEGWYYLWGGTGKTTPAIQWVPMALKKYQTSPAAIDRFIAAGGVQTIIGYNEPEGHYKGAQDRAARELRNLMKTGLRIGGPNLTQAGPQKWLPDYWELAKEQNSRLDFLCVHWYDWSRNPKKNRTDSAEDIFARLRKYLRDVHARYQLPLWITEFNANPYRDNATQIAFLKLAMPYLDSCPYVERYAYFQPFGVNTAEDLGATDTARMDKAKGSGDFREVRNDPDSPLTPIGKLWRDHVSVPAMDREVYLGKNNLCGDEVEE